MEERRTWKVEKVTFNFLCLLQREGGEGEGEHCAHVVHLRVTMRRREKKKLSGAFFLQLH